MKLTNKLSYPQSVVIAAEKSIQRPAWDNIRVTELLSGLLTKYLAIKYWDELVVDVDDLLLPMFGTAWHQYLSGWNSPNEVHNKRWYATISDVVLSGETDIYRNEYNFLTELHHKGIIEDNKVTSAWAFAFGRKEWEYQLNSYAYLVRANNYPIHELYINAFLRDWSKYEAMKDRQKEYPKNRFYRLLVPLWSVERQLTYLQSRIELHKIACGFDNNASYNVTNSPFVCTPEERWERKETWAVKKKGRLSALRVADTFEQATTLAKKFKGDIYIEHRKGKAVKCDEYCICRDVCPVREK